MGENSNSNTTGNKLQGVFLKDGFSDEVLARAQPLMETPEFTTEEIRELCIRANTINQNIIATKVFKLMKNPKQSIRIAKGY